MLSKSFCFRLVKSGWSWRFLFPAVLIHSSIFACLCISSVPPVSAAVAGIVVQVTVDPVSGNDSLCATSGPCKTIAHSVQVVGASQVMLSPGVFNESTVDIYNVAFLIVSGAPSSTLFDCSRRLQPATQGAAFNISNSSVTFTGITFQHCSNTNSSGGAVSAVDSSVTVSNCSFVNCSASNGGAVAATGRGGDLFLNVRNSSFTRNAAIGGDIGCPSGARSSEPCSTWGGAVAAFEIRNVSVSGCKMVENSVVAVVPVDSPQYNASRNAVAGGGCVSIVFSGNSSSSTMHFSDNSFAHCTVDVSSRNRLGFGNIRNGNGNVYCCSSVMRWIVMPMLLLSLD
jgi:hypothetical protein